MASVILVKATRSPRLTKKITSNGHKKLQNTSTLRNPENKEKKNHKETKRDRQKSKEPKQNKKIKNSIPRSNVRIIQVSTTL